MKKTYGSLYGIGIGPGDPELITIKGYKIIQETPTIFIPKKSHKDSSFALSIVKDLIDPVTQKVIELVFPMIRDAAELDRHREHAADNIYKSLSSGNNCAFITEGDPFLYSTFLHLYKTFKQKYPSIQIEVIPGITSINASSCKALFPLSESKEKIAILPAVYHVEDLREIINSFDTVILLKIHSVIDKIITVVKGFGQSVTIIFVQRCGTAEELIIENIASLNGIKPDYLSLMIIKNVKAESFQKSKG